MNRVILLLPLLGVSVTSSAEELISTLSWQEAAEAGLLLGGVVTAEDVLTIEATAEAHQLMLIEFDQPGISQPVYALRGLIRYEDVDGVGFLQMDNRFEGKGTFFSKTLADAGPLQKISGSSEWRTFVLPFFANTGDAADDPPLLPQKLWLSIFLPGSGTVQLKDVALYQYASGQNPMQGAIGGAGATGLMGAIGAIGGTILGLWGAMLGTLSGRGKARGFVMGSLNVLPVLGALCILWGLMALVMSPHAGIHYPLMAIGILLVASFGLRATLRARYEAQEFRRMQSLDADI